MFDVLKKYYPEYQIDPDFISYPPPPKPLPNLPPVPPKGFTVSPFTFPPAPTPQILSTTRHISKFRVRDNPPDTDPLVLTEPYTGLHVSHYLKALQSPEPTLRLQAARKLETLFMSKEEYAVEAVLVGGIDVLVGALMDSSVDLREHVARCLESVSRTLPGREHLLTVSDKDPDENVPEHGATHLSRSPSVRALVACLHDSSLSVRVSGLQTIANLVSPADEFQAVSALIVPLVVGPVLTVLREAAATPAHSQGTESTPGSHHSPAADPPLDSQEHDASPHGATDTQPDPAPLKSLVAAGVRVLALACLGQEGFLTVLDAGAVPVFRTLLETSLVRDDPGLARAVVHAVGALCEFGVSRAVLLREGMGPVLLGLSHHLFEAAAAAGGPGAAAGWDALGETLRTIAMYAVDPDPRQEVRGRGGLQHIAQILDALLPHAAAVCAGAYALPPHHLTQHMPRPTHTRRSGSEAHAHTGSPEPGASVQGDPSPSIPPPVLDNVLCAALSCAVVLADDAGGRRDAHVMRHTATKLAQMTPRGQRPSLQPQGSGFRFPVLAQRLLLVISRDNME